MADVEGFARVSKVSSGKDPPQDCLFAVVTSSMLGVVASAVLHRVNNVLTSLLGWAELLGSSPKTPTEIDADLQKLRAAADEVRSLIADWLILSTDDPRNLSYRQVLHISEIWKRYERLIAPLLRKKQVTFRTDLKDVVARCPLPACAQIVTAAMLLAMEEGEGPLSPRSFDVEWCEEAGWVIISIRGPFRPDLVAHTSSKAFKERASVWIQFLRERIAALGGSVHSSLDPAGIRLEIRLPLDNRSGPEETLQGEVSVPGVGEQSDD